MGFFGGMGGDRTAKLKARGKKAKQELAYYKERERVRSDERKAKELRLAPVKEKVSAFKEGLKSLKQRNQKSGAFKKASNDVYTSSTSDRVRGLYFGEGGGDKTRALLYGKKKRG